MTKLFIAGMAATYYFDLGGFAYTFIGFMAFMHYSEKATTIPN